MKKLLTVIMTIILIGCSSMYYDRPYNKESELLNDYIAEFFMHTEPYHFNFKIILDDTLRPLEKNTWVINLQHDSLCGEAYYDLCDSNKKQVPVNFSQLSNIKGMNIFPGKFCINEKTRGWHYQLSLPGYNKDSTIMYFSYRYYCGFLCSRYSIVYMKKINGEWVFQGERILIES